MPLKNLGDGNSSIASKISSSIGGCEKRPAPSLNLGGTSSVLTTSNSMTSLSRRSFVGAPDAVIKGVEKNNSGASMAYNLPMLQQNRSNYNQSTTTPTNTTSKNNNPSSSVASKYTDALGINHRPSHQIRKSSNLF